MSRIHADADRWADAIMHKRKGYPTKEDLILSYRHGIDDAIELVAQELAALLRERVYDRDL